MPAPAATASRTRVDVYDGLRGIAVVLVVLSHLWLVWPRTRGEGSLVARTLLENGNYAVSFFFVVGAFLYTRGLVARAASTEGLHPGVQLVRRLVRLTPTLLVLLLVLWVVERISPTEAYAEADLGTSAQHVLSYTWNWYVKDNPLVARPDLGHLWYLSVDMQVFVLVLLLVWLLRRHQDALVAVLGLLLVAVLVWRTHVYQTEGVYQALLRTNARMDAPLAGALAALLLPRLTRLRPYAPAMVWGSLVAMVALAPFTIVDVRFFRLPGDLLDLALVAFVVGCAIAPVPTLVSKVVGSYPLAVLGRRSLSVYVWHFPIFMALYYRTPDWGWPERTALAALLVTVASLGNDLVIERQVSRLLTSAGWRRLDRGIPAFLAASALAAMRRDETLEDRLEPAAPVVDPGLVESSDLGTADDVEDRAALEVSLPDESRRAAAD